jgi:hypothetical protein
MFGAFGSETAKGPLHRMTPLRDDPAVAWLSPEERSRVAILVFSLWALFWIAVPPAFFSLSAGLAYLLPIYSVRVAAIVIGTCVAGVYRAVRRAIIRTRSERIERILRRDAADLAADDWTALAAEPNDTIVSVVGWVRGRQHLAHPIGGERAVGLGLPCQQRYPGVFEVLHDFDLVDEEGRSIFIQVAEARLYGEPNVALDSHQLRLLYAALEVASGATPSGWYVHRLRDGDPVMVVGAKQDFLDPADPGFRGRAPRPALAAAPPRPLLIFSLPAERREV